MENEKRPVPPAEDSRPEEPPAVVDDEIENPGFSKHDWDEIRGAVPLPPGGLESGGLPAAQESGELPEEDDDNPDQESDEALPEDEEEKAMRHDLGGSGIHYEPE